MRYLKKSLAAFALIGLGYLLGAAGRLPSGLLWAQAETEEAPSAAELTGATEETLTKVRTALAALKGAADALQEEQKYVPATSGINVFAVSVGGIDAVKDLEAGRGVDPETFAALYAGQATDEVSAKLGYDAEHRLTYNNRLLRMYPLARIKKLYQVREAILGSKSTGDSPAATTEEPEEPEEE